MKINILPILISALLISCVKMPESNVKPIEDLVIHPDFDWKTVKELNVTVTVTPVDAQSADKAHVIRIYNSPLLNTGALMATGVAKPNASYVVKLSVSAPIQNLYVHETKPNGLVKVSKLPISSSTLSIAFDKRWDNDSFFTKSTFMTGQNALFTSPSIAIPTGYDQIVNNNNTLNTLGFNTGESSAYGNTYKSYLIPTGYTRTAAIDFSNYRSHAIIYVQGTLNINAEINLNNSSIVVLTGGRVICEGINTGSFTNTSSNPIPIVYLQNNAIITSEKHISLNNNVITVNKGTLIVDGNNFDLDMNNASKVYNEGTIRILNSKSQLLITNSAQLFNSGLIESPDVEMSVSSTTLNDVTGVINIQKWYQTNTTVLTNHGEIVATTYFKTSGGGTVYNFCKILAELSDLTQITAFLEPGSYWSSQDFKVNNSNITMVGGSMFQTANVSAIYKMSLQSSSASFSLFKNTGNMPDLRWAQTTFSGNIEYVQTTLTEGTGANGRGLYETSFINGAILTKVQTKNIPGTTCNGSFGQIIPDDDDEDDPETPDPLYGVFFPSQTGWGTYAFEDQWPQKGDYDLNDLVTAFRVSFYSNSSNQIVELHFDYKIAAVGATFNIGAAFQMDNVPASNVTSVSGSLLGGSTSPFPVDARGTESGISTAVIPVFNHTKTVVSYSGFLNTERGSFTPTEEKRVVVKFTNPVPQSQLSMESFNFFIVVNQRSREVHLPGFLGTTKFDVSLASGVSLHPNDNFKDAQGMMWGLMFPEYFSYPLERKAIINAYTHFAAWATSSGAQYPDWFMDKAGYRNESLIY
jgi:LruC domain-containing protein